MTILVVDDQPAIRDVLTEILTDEGYPVVAATNGLEAITHLHESAELPHLTLLDLRMPVMSGWEFLREVRQDPALASIPVVVMTAGTTLEHDLLKAGATAYILKPIDINSFLRTVQQYHPRP